MDNCPGYFGVTVMKRVLSAAAASACLLGPVAHAGIGADVSAGTPGVSGNIHLQLNPFITIRGGVNFFEFDLEEMEFDGIEYDADLGLTQVGGYLDLHPFMNGFTLSGGVLTGEREISLTARPTEDVEIGNETFTAAEVGELTGSANFGDLSYYAGFGWDSTTHGLNPIAFVIRVGVLMTDSPSVDLISTGGTLDPIIREELTSELAVEARQLEDDLEAFQFFPMVSFGIGFGF